MMAAAVPVARPLGAPQSGSAQGAQGTGGAGGPRRPQAPTPTRVAVVSAGAGSSPPPADGVRRALRARVRPVALRRRRGHGQVLACGIIEHGFARIRCDDCAREYLLAFSCKRRYFCPNCHAKRLAIWAQWLDTTLLAPVPHRQVVLTIAKRLRAYCLYRRRLLGEIARIAARTVTTAIRTLTGERDLVVGIVACLQTTVRSPTGIRTCARASPRRLGVARAVRRRPPRPSLVARVDDRPRAPRPSTRPEVPQRRLARPGSRGRSARAPIPHRSGVTGRRPAAGPTGRPETRADGRQTGDRPLLDRTRAGGAA